MKKIILLGSCLLTLMCASSCMKETIDLTENNIEETHKVDFLAHMEEDVEMATRTGVKLKLIHTWINTKVEDVHLFEKENSSGDILEGSKISMVTESPYEIATFSASFLNKIVVTPETKASTAPVYTKSYTYTGIVASQNQTDKKYYIPAVQYPQKDSWIDPEADFIIGKAFVNGETLHKKTIDFSFKRAVAISRLAITNIEGTYIKSVTINSDDELTGSAGYFDIDFDACTANLTGGSKTLQMIFPENTKKSGTTYANFVCSTGDKHITSVIVETDEWIYTKTLDVTATFVSNTFCNIAMDMTPGEDCTKEHSSKQALRFMKGEEVITSDSYDLASQESYIAPELTGAADGAEITYSSDKTDIATVSKDGETGKLVVTPIATGEVNITATAAAVENFDETSLSYTLTITNSSVPVDQTLQFETKEFQYVYGETFTEPSLVGAFTTVTYSAEPETVATINETTGKLSFTGVAGTVTVTATAAAGTVEGVAYNEGSDSYTVTVTLPSTDVTYYKAKTADSGYSYLIVNGGYALANSDGTVSATSVTVNSGTITLSEADNLLWTVVPETDSDLLKYGSYHLTNDSKYLSRISGGTSSSKLEIHAATDEEVSSSMNYTMWSNDESIFWNTSIRESGGSVTTTKYYAYISDNSWVINTTEPSSETVLYTSRQPRNLAFSNVDNAKIDLANADKTFKATLSGVSSDVTYISDNEDVATVDQDGTVTGVSKGKVKITAKADPSAQYQGDEVNYELEVVDSNSPDLYYVKATSNIVDGTYLIVATDSDDKFAFDATAGDNDYKSAVIVSNDKILSTNDLKDAAVEITASGEKYYIKTSKGYLYVDSDTDIAFNSTKDEKYLHSCTISNGSVTLKNKGEKSSEQNFRYSNSNDKFQYSSSSGSFTLYLLDGSSRTSRGLSFETAECSKSISDSDFTNTLNGISTGASFSSSKESVATVNSETGLVHIVGEGTTTITVSAPKTDTYSEGNASYTLTVTDPSTTKYFVKITSLSDINETDTYIITNTDGTKAFKGILEEGEASFVEKDSNNSVAVTKSSAKIVDGTALSACKFTFTKHATDEGKYYINFTSAAKRFFLYASSTKFAAKALTETGNSMTIAASDGNFTISRSSSSTYYLRYSSSNDYFYAYSSSSSSVAIYKLEK